MPPEEGRADVSVDEAGEPLVQELPLATAQRGQARQLSPQGDGGGGSHSVRLIVADDPRSGAADVRV